MTRERWAQLSPDDRERQTAQAIVTAAYCAGKNPMLREALNILTLRLDDYEREIATLKAMKQEAENR